MNNAVHMQISSKKYITTIANTASACSTTIPTVSGVDGDAMSTVTFDASGNPIMLTDPLGHAVRQRFDGFDRAVTISANVDEVSGHQIEKVQQYDAEGHIVAASSHGSADGATYPTPLPLLQRIDYEFDEIGRLRKSWNLYERDGILDTCTSHTSCTPSSDRKALETSYSYDGSGRLLSVLGPMQTTMSSDYDELGRKWRTVDPMQNPSLYCYDPAGNVVKTTTTEISQVTGVNGVPNRSFTTAWHFDSLGRRSSSAVDPGTGHLTLTTTHAYDARDLLESTTDPQGHIAERYYDQIGRLTSTVVPSSSNSYNTNGLITEMLGYDKDSNVTSMKDDLDNVTHFDFDAMGRALQVRYPDGSGKRALYDLAGRVGEIKLQKALGTNPANPTNCGATQCIKVTNQFDAIGRLLVRSVDLSNAPNTFEGTMAQSFSYDGLSRLIHGEDENKPGYNPDNSAITRTYDTLSRLLSDSQQVQAGGSPITKRVTSTYDDASRRIQITYNADSTTNQSRTYTIVPDAFSRITAISEGAASIASYKYMGAGVPLERLYPGPDVAMRRFVSGQDLFDGAGRATGLLHQTSAATVTPQTWFHHTYGYDSDSRRTYELHRERPVAGLPVTAYRGNVWTYDQSDRLASAENRDLDAAGNPVGSVAAQDLVRQYTHDGLGNWREHEEKNPGSSTTESFAQTLQPLGTLGYGMNQYASWKATPGNPPSGGTAISYDFLGNVTMATLKVGGTQKTLHFYYDFAGRVVRIDLGSSDIVYNYDALNRRIAKRPSGSPEFFIYDGWRAIEDYFGANEVPENRYVWGNRQDELLMMEDASGQKYYFAEDYLGSIIGVTNSAGGSVATYEYGPFGELISECANGATPPCAPNGSTGQFQFRYTGQRYDAESGLYYYKNRFYSAELGRFLTRDPVGSRGGANQYALVRNFPTALIDTFGLNEWPVRSFPNSLFQALWKDTNQLLNSDGINIESMIFVTDDEIATCGTRGGDWAIDPAAPPAVAFTVPQATEIFINDTNGPARAFWNELVLNRQDPDARALAGAVMVHEWTHTKQVSKDEPHAYLVNVAFLRKHVAWLGNETPRPGTFQYFVWQYYIASIRQAGPAGGRRPPFNYKQSCVDNNCKAQVAVSASAVNMTMLTPSEFTGTYNGLIDIALTSSDPATRAAAARAAFDMVDDRFHPRSSEPEKNGRIYAEVLGTQGAFAAQQNACFDNPLCRRPGMVPHALGM